MLIVELAPINLAPSMKLTFKENQLFYLNARIANLKYHGNNSMIIRL